VYNWFHNRRAHSKRKQFAPTSEPEDETEVESPREKKIRVESVQVAQGHVHPQS